MDRNEFMELVYETFADEPDNVLANGIIEAADSYAEHEKAQLSQEDATKDATSDLISRTETVEHLRGVLDVTVPITDYDGGYVDGVEVGISTVSTMPTIQPVATDTNVGSNSEIPNSSDCISRQAAIDALDCINGAEEVLRSLPSAQPEPQWIPVEKELPEPRIDVWVNSDLGQMVGYYEEMVNLWYGRDYLELIVNAWMPLPEAYKPNNK